MDIHSYAFDFVYHADDHVIDGYLSIQADGEFLMDDVIYID